MTWPTPMAGMLIRYSFLWDEEAQAGREEGVKDRPCAIVLVTLARGEDTRVRVLPVTHSPPHSGADAIEIPFPIKRRLGLDTEPSWIVLSEMNDFAWPGPDVRPIGSTGSPVYGFLPNVFFRYVLTQFVKKRARVTRRT